MPGPPHRARFRDHEPNTHSAGSPATASGPGRARFARSPCPARSGRPGWPFKDDNPLWQSMHRLLALLPAGYWTTYGDLAKVLGTAAQPLGNRLATVPAPNAHRVLTSQGEISASRFGGSSPIVTTIPERSWSKRGSDSPVAGQFRINACPSRYLSRYERQPTMVSNKQRSAASAPLISTGRRVGLRPQ